LGQSKVKQKKANSVSDTLKLPPPRFIAYFGLTLSQGPSGGLHLPSDAVRKEVGNEMEEEVMVVMVDMVEVEEE